MTGRARVRASAGRLAAVGAMVCLGALGLACGATGERQRAPDPAPGSQHAAADPARRGGDVVAALDREFTRRWAEAGVSVAPAVSDEAFLRRASLDLIGRVPTVQERARFLSAPAATRRAAAVDRMLASEDFAEYWGQRHAQQLLGDVEGVRPRLVQTFEQWVVDAVRDGQGWDDIVAAVLSAEGPVDEDRAGALLVALGRQGQDALVTARVSESILGVQLECAQCHDHPYADFSSEDFWGMAAYFARTRVRFDREVSPPMPSLVETRRGESRIASVDGGPRDLKIAPSFLGQGEADPTVGPGKAAAYTPGGRRARLTEHVLASPLTAKAVVGRLWTDLFGAGLEEPWNDLGGPAASHDPALELLAAELVEHDWDLRWLLKTMVLSEAYGRSAEGPEAGRHAAERLFARAQVRPLCAEQIYGSLIVVSGFDAQSGREFRRATGQRRRATLREVQAVFPAPGEQTGMDGELTVAQMLWLLNGGMTNAAVDVRTGTELGDMVDELASNPAHVEVQVEALYHRIYGRAPRADEVERVTALVGAAPDAAARAGAWEDVAFAMLVSTEFITNH